LKQKYKYSTIARGNCGGVQVPKLCNGNCLEYKYQIATETAEWNTSKQVSAKETVLRNVYDYLRINIFFFFLSGVNAENGVEEMGWR